MVLVSADVGGNDRLPMRKAESQLPASGISWRIGMHKFVQALDSQLDSGRLSVQGIMREVYKRVVTAVGLSLD